MAKKKKHPRRKSKWAIQCGNRIVSRHHKMDRARVALRRRNRKSRQPCQIVAGGAGPSHHKGMGKRKSSRFFQPTQPTVSYGPSKAKVHGPIRKARAARAEKRRVRVKEPKYTIVVDSNEPVRTGPASPPLTVRPSRNRRRVVERARVYPGTNRGRRPWTRSSPDMADRVAEAFRRGAKAQRIAEEEAEVESAIREHEMDVATGVREGGVPYDEDAVRGMRRARPVMPEHRPDITVIPREDIY